MSGGLNGQFKANPVQVLDQCWDINSSQNLLGTRYVLDQHSVGYFDLRRLNANTISLEPAPTGFSALVSESPVKAYYLCSTPNQRRNIILTNHADYFFTDTITGCQFAAYGINRHAVNVEHLNALNNSLQYARRAIELRGIGAPLNVIYGATEYRGTGFRTGENVGNTVVTVVGWRRPDGWHFYARRRLNDHGNNRALDNASFELT
ncbi:hypothetical protein [Polyangium sp. y55x31]|uniref:hypothetical protein n=1 Tax=Polyangium sp. y55x31 TaxID=3042688 RepID=UPI0024830233|nr:hypothetical protein [Polyangium sp. y55x31]MDI1479277.1 hypothetical protein [Polyangium sp. y55x31]